MPRGFTLLQLIVAMAIVSGLTAFAMVILPGMRGRLPCNQGCAGIDLKQLCTYEAVWRTCDSDKNGVADYWVRDVAAFHAIHDANGKAIALIALSFGRADAAPAFVYPELGGIRSAKQGFCFRAMISDQDGTAYITGRNAPVTAPPAKGICTNSSRFGFVAYPATYGLDGVITYMVSEDGVVWQRDPGRTVPVPLDRSSTAPPGSDTTWSQFGG